ncbi:MAG TPA: adenylate/guanylate cyclase domain-containing protein [Solirubrobacterales bacterium]|nr:adenylate/guanylate cyclase domain-containing protein [Solirubrobacterales bacterium]
MEVLLTVLAVVGCMAMMGAAMAVMPPVARRVRRNPPIQRLIARLRRQSAIDRVLSWAEDEQPDLKRATAPDGTVTVLFTDIEDSTKLNERLGDQGWIEVLRAHNQVVHDCVRGHGGYEVKSQGDGFMIAYPSARRGLECAIDMQRNLAGANGGDLTEPLRVRIGLHTGEAIREGDDFYGRSVTLAARIADEAEGGEILASSLVRELAASGGDIFFEEAGEVRLKGLRGTQRIYRVPWEQPGSASPRLRAAGRAG